jgi:hypothetical protein
MRFALVTIILMCAWPAASQVAPSRPRPPMAPVAPLRPQAIAPLVVAPAPVQAPDTVARRSAFQRELARRESQLNVLSAELAAQSRVASDETTAGYVVEAETTKIEMNAMVEAMKHDLDTMSEVGEMESLRLQMAMDRLSRMMATLSNILKKISDTSQSITQNLK